MAALVNDFLHKEYRQGEVIFDRNYNAGKPKG